MFAFLRRKKRREWIEAQHHWLGLKPSTPLPTPDPARRRARVILLAVLIVMLLASGSYARTRYLQWQKEHKEETNQGEYALNEHGLGAAGGGASVPEPSSFVLCGMGAAGLYAIARRGRQG